MDRLLERDLTVKILSVFLAIVLWFRVTTDRAQVQPRTYDRVPVEITNLDPSLIPADGGWIAGYVRVTVRGSQIATLKLRPEDIRARVDLRGAAPGQSFRAVEVTPPKGLEVVEVVPSQLPVSIDSRALRKVPVTVSVVGAPAEDFAAGNQEWTPREVTVEGPKLRVDQVSIAFGQLSIDGATKDVEDKKFPVKALAKNGEAVNEVRITPDRIQVRVPVKQLPPGVSVPVDPKVIGQPAPGYRVGSIKTKETAVKVRGAIEKLRMLTSVATEPIDVKGVSASVTREVRVILPEGGEMAQPDRVTVTVEIIADTVVRTLENLPMVATNLDTGLTAQIAPGTVTAKLEGPRAVMEKLKPADMEFFVDARGAAAGDYQLQVQARLPEGIRLVEKNPSIVTVVISAAKPQTPAR